VIEEPTLHQGRLNEGERRPSGRHAERHRSKRLRVASLSRVP
jgi:hypothetical protein